VKLHSIIKENCVAKNDVIALLKATKNVTEQNGMRNANTRDCVAIMRYFAFLEEELNKKNHGLTEWQGTLVLDDYCR